MPDLFECAFGFGIFSVGQVLNLSYGKNGQVKNLSYERRIQNRKAYSTPARKKFFRLSFATKTVYRTGLNFCPNRIRSSASGFESKAVLHRCGPNLKLGTGR